MICEVLLTMAKKTTEYTNESITSLKGADRVRKRPAVIFGSDGIEGCQHSIFEIISNSIDEAREGHGNKIIITETGDYGKSGKYGYYTLVAKVGIVKDGDYVIVVKRNEHTREEFNMHYDSTKAK